MILRAIILAGSAFMLNANAHAASLVPSSYDMPNGSGQAHGGSFNYWDGGYTGAGSVTVDNAPLSGGHGALTDGVVSSQNWQFVSNIAGLGPYVGWRPEFMSAPLTVTFHFAQNVDVHNIVVHSDDSDNFGGVLPPATIRVQAGAFGTELNVPDHAGSAPYFIDLADLLGGPLGVTGVNAVSLTFTSRTQAAWVFIDEVTFDGQASAVPLPGSTALLLGALPFLLRRRSANAHG